MPWLALVRAWAMVTAATGKEGWGEMPREAFERPDDADAPLAALHPLRTGEISSQAARSSRISWTRRAAAMVRS